MTKESIEKRVNLALNVLNSTNAMIRMGALASDSCIIDKELQTSNEDYYLLLKEISIKIQESINLLSD